MEKTETKIIIPLVKKIIIWKAEKLGRTKVGLPHYLISHPLLKVITMYGEKAYFEPRHSSFSHYCTCEIGKVGTFLKYLYMLQLDKRFYNNKHICFLQVIGYIISRQ